MVCAIVGGRCWSHSSTVVPAGTRAASAVAVGVPTSRVSFGWHGPDLNVVVRLHCRLPMPSAFPERTIPSGRQVCPPKVSGARVVAVEGLHRQYLAETFVRCSTISTRGKLLSLRSRQPRQVARRCSGRAPSGCRRSMVRQSPDAVRTPPRLYMIVPTLMTYGGLDGPPKPFG